MISVHFQGKPFNTTVIQVYAPTINAKETEVEQFYDDLRDHLELKPRKYVLFIRGLECESRKSSDTWSKSKFVLELQIEAGQRLTVLLRERTGHGQHPFPTTQEKTLHMDITRWSITKSDWLYSLQSKVKNLYFISKNKTRS